MIAIAFSSFDIIVALATSEASRTRLEQECSIELETWKETEMVLRQKLDEASTNCKQAHMSLAALASKKEKLEKENVELNSVCEELMTMVEGGNN